MRQTLLLIALALAAPTAQAQAVYRSVMPNGGIIYGDKPAPGAKESKQVNLTPSNIATPGPVSTPAPAAKQQVLDSSNDKVDAARQALDQARTALEAGREPKPDERIGTKGGSSRLTDAYLERVKVLEDAVAAAQRQLDDSLSRRNAAK